MAQETRPVSKEIHPIEVAALYKSVMEKTLFLSDTTEIREGVNQNQLQARDTILAVLKDFGDRGEGAIIALMGTMASGKSTTICLMALRLASKGFLVYKHRRDVSRTGEMLVNATGHVAVEAFLYESVQELEDRKILFVDEFQFNTVDTDAEIRDFLLNRKRSGLHTVAGQLDFNFRRDPWRTTKVLLPLSDKIIVLRARCSKCEGPAQFVQRNRPDGTPARIDDPEIEVGAVGEGGIYKPMCWRCHRVGGKEPSRLQTVSPNFPH